MTSKYSIAKDVLTKMVEDADKAEIDQADAYDALLVSIIDMMKVAGRSNDLRSLLQVELDNLGSGGIYELPRGGGHS